MTTNTSPPRRSVRSFVRREGRMTRSQRAAFETLWSRYGITLEAGMTDLRTAFPRPAPLVLEIGFGMGDSLASMAAADSERNYLGIEVHRPGVGHLLARLAREQIDNVRVVNADAVEVLEKHVVDASLDAVLVFFPDPWPKTRHHKRRLIQPVFVSLLARKLRLGGLLHLATDWQHYAEHMLDTVSRDGGFVNRAGEGHYSPRPDYRPLTKFEQRGQRLGHGIWDLLFERSATNRSPADPAHLPSHSD